MKLFLQGNKEILEAQSQSQIGEMVTNGITKKKQTMALSHTIILKAQPCPRAPPRASDCHLTSRMERAGRSPSFWPVSPRRALLGHGFEQLSFWKLSGGPSSLAPSLGSATLPHSHPQSSSQHPCPASPSPAGTDTEAGEGGKQCLYMQIHTYAHAHTQTHADNRNSSRRMHEDLVAPTLSRKGNRTAEGLR